jgi:putative membrane protein
MKQTVQVDWQHPQRQPVAGIVIVFIKTLWQVLKRIWPFILLMLFNVKPGRVEKYALIAAALSLFTIAGSIIQFIFFRFYILNEELIIKKGWLKKETIIVPLHRIQTVHIEESFLHSALGIVKVAIDTAGSGKTEVNIDALRKDMAEELKFQLYEKKEITGVVENVKPVVPPALIRLTGRDLFKLSLSANHVEAFFILLSFVVGLYDNIKNINLPFLSENDSLLSNYSIPVFSFLVFSVLFITIMISTIRIVLKYFDFTLFNTAQGYQIRSGLTNVKERMVGRGKIQFVSWRANWIRKRMGLWILEYAMAGSEEMKNKMKVQIPVTEKKYISILTENYISSVETMQCSPVTIHPSYVWRRFLFSGLVPAVILIAVSVSWWGAYSFLILIYAFWTGFTAYMFQKKFSLATNDDALLIHKGKLGIENVLLKWYKVQSGAIQQSLYQRRKGLATIILYTAGGTVRCPYIALEAAHAISNFCLYKIEETNKKWM